MHERLFADDPPLNTRSGSFPRKILRHAEPFTFYSAPTKGELNLMAQKRRHTREKEKEKEKERGRERERENQREKASPASNDSDRRGRIPRGTQEPETTSLSETAVTAEQSTGELAVDKAGPPPLPEVSDGERESANEEHGLETSSANLALVPEVSDGQKGSGNEQHGLVTSTEVKLRRRFLFMT